MTAAYSYSQGIRLYRQGRFDEAVAALSCLVEEAGLMGRLARYYTAQACRQEGMALARQGQLQAAQDYLRRTVRLIGPSADLACYLARLYTQMGLHRQAEAQFESAAGARGDTPATLAGLALAQHRDGRAAQAMLTLEDALRRHAGSAELHVQMGLMLAREDRHAEARDHFLKAIECDCLNADAHYYLGLCEAAQGLCAQAARRLERAHALRPQDVMLAYQLAVLARASADQGTPVQLALREQRDPPAATDLRCLADFVAGENDFVTAFLALPESPADEELFGLLAAVLETALELHPHYADLHLRQSFVMQRLGHGAAALEHARKAVQINPHYVQARIQLGRLLAEASPPEAVEHLQLAVESGGDYADVHVLLGQLCLRLGHPIEARRALDQAVRINPHYRQAVEAISQLAA